MIRYLKEFSDQAMAFPFEVVLTEKPVRRGVPQEFFFFLKSIFTITSNAGSEERAIWTIS